MWDTVKHTFRFEANIRRRLLGNFSGLDFRFDSLFSVNLIYSWFNSVEWTNRWRIVCLHCSGHRTMLLFVTALLALVGPTWGENPAVRVTLTDKGLQYGKAGGAVRGQLEAVKLTWRHKECENVYLSVGQILVCCLSQESTQVQDGFRTRWRWSPSPTSAAPSTCSTLMWTTHCQGRTTTGTPRGLQLPKSPSQQDRLRVVSLSVTALIWVLTTACVCPSSRHAQNQNRKVWLSRASCGILQRLQGTEDVHLRPQRFTSRRMEDTVRYTVSGCPTPHTTPAWHPSTTNTLYTI